MWTETLRSVQRRQRVRKGLDRMRNRRQTKHDDNTQPTEQQDTNWQQTHPINNLPNSREFLLHIHILDQQAVCLSFSGSVSSSVSYLLLFGEDSVADADRLLVLVHLVVFLVHPLVKRVCVQNPLGVDLQEGGNTK